jgi:methionyl-tRNA formyltransferase
VRKLRIIVVVDETSYYHPDLMQGLLENLNSEIAGVARVTKIKSSLFTWIAKRTTTILPGELARMLWRNVGCFLQNITPYLPKKRFYVKSVLKNFNKESIDVEYNINKPEYLTWISNKKPDLIICFSFLYFGDEILKIPSLGCINRHSSLLPSYAGVLPIFNAIRFKETNTGVTIHFMTKEFDAGEIITQIEYPFDNTKSVDILCIQNFKYALTAILESVEKIRRGNLVPVTNSYPKSYFSSPKKEEIKKFRDVNGRFI